MANEFTANAELLAWVEEVAALTQAEGVRWCEGTEAEYEELTGELVEGGTFIRLAADVRPDSFLCRSDPADVARVEDRTFICSRTKEEAGPTNNWADAGEMKEKLTALYRGCMRRRTMYVIAYSMGPIGSPVGRMGVEVTDSAYVAVSMHKMARVGREVLRAMGDSADFVRGIHSVGYPLDETQADVPWPCNAAHKYICHFPETREIWSYGSGYGGNALLGKKCHALRIASVQARDEGWLAEHMLILKLTSPAGEAKYIAGAFPSACGKTNLAMLEPSLPGWKVETIGDDIAWMKFRQDGEGRMRLFAINPEAGFFGVAPGTSVRSNPNAMRTISRGTIFTNCALTREGDVWWEGMTGEAPKVLSDWTRRHWTPSVRRRAAHANARFTVGAGQCPVMAREWDDPDGVPISAILFGGRRAGIVPLVTEAFSWQHGVFMGATMASETTAAAGGKVGALRRDPMAMLPFCGYHMGDYFGHWLKLGAEAAGEGAAGGVPRIFQVNWFRKDGAGKFIWPGYGENARVLKWIFERCDGRAGARETAIGYVPGEGALDVSGLAVTGEALRTLLEVDVAGWLGEVGSIGEHFAKFGARLPGELKEELSGLEARLFSMQEQG